MKRQPKKAKEAVEEFPVWTFEQAGRAIPYVASIMSSIRDQYLQAQGLRHRSRKLEARPGRPDRRTIIQQEEAKREADRLQDQILDSAKELAQLNVHCVDPVNGLAMIPFVQGGQLAWLVFSLFDETKITSWRYHHDPLTARRPLDEIEFTPIPATIVA